MHGLPRRVWDPECDRNSFKDATLQSVLLLGASNATALDALPQRVYGKPNECGRNSFKDVTLQSVLVLGASNATDLDALPRRVWETECGRNSFKDATLQ